MTNERGAPEPQKPNFLIIGAARSGTTTLYSILQQHRDIYLPKNKRPEPHFFLKEKEFRQGFRYYLTKYFSDTQGCGAIGECSTSYLYQPYVPQRIADFLPDIRLIAILRDPVERAYSNYVISMQNGFETLSFRDAVEAESERLTNITDPYLQEIAPFSYIDRGKYFHQLKRYAEHFSADQIHTILFEDFIENPESTVKRVCRFLGVDDDFAPPILRAQLNASDPCPPMAPELRRKLIGLFEEDRKALEQLTGHDLGHWACC
jgi:hypothetical protein